MRLLSRAHVPFEHSAHHPADGAFVVACRFELLIERLWHVDVETQGLFVGAPKFAVQLPALRPKRFRAAGGCIDLAGVCGVAWGFLAYGADITGFAWGHFENGPEGACMGLIRSRARTVMGLFRRTGPLPFLGSLFVR